jgi:hypothetical protein
MRLSLCKRPLLAQLPRLALHRPLLAQLLLHQ